jgi:transcription elongation factor Elf1
MKIPEKIKNILNKVITKFSCNKHNFEPIIVTQDGNLIIYQCKKCKIKFMVWNRYKNRWIEGYEKLINVVDSVGLYDGVGLYTNIVDFYIEEIIKKLF